MKRILIIMVALATTLKVYATPELQQPLYVVDGKAISIEQVQCLASDIESMTIFKSDEDVKRFAHLGDTSNGVVVLTLKSSAEEELPFLFAEVMPQFMGGDLLAFRSWVMQNLRYPEGALQMGLEDAVVVQFIVDRNGYIEQESVDIIQSSYPDIFGTEVKRVIGTSPRWTPGVNNGHTVAVSFCLPITFKVEGSARENGEDSLKVEHPNEIVIQAYGGSGARQGDDAPIYVIDGVPSTAEVVKSLPASAIKQVVLLKDTEMLSYYKDYGNIENGVMIIHTNSLDANVENSPDTLPIFMDSGFESFYKWLMQNLRYPVELRQKNLSSHMVVEFIVNSVGYIEIVDINTIKGTADKQFEDEVRRVMLSAPQWKPGVKDGKPVACRMTIPVVFGTME